MISKELLSEVLDRDLLEHHIYKAVVRYKIDNEYNWFDDINLYELAHKCKEWAFDRGYIIESGDRTTVSIKAYLHDGNRNNTVTFGGMSEVSAIFQACEWILKTVSKDTKGEEDD